MVVLVCICRAGSEMHTAGCVHRVGTQEMPSAVLGTLPARCSVSGFVQTGEVFP